VIDPVDHRHVSTAGARAAGAASSMVRMARKSCCTAEIKPKSAVASPAGTLPMNPACWCRQARPMECQGQPQFSASFGSGRAGCRSVRRPLHNLALGKGAPQSGAPAPSRLLPSLGRPGIPDAIGRPGETRQTTADDDDAAHSGLTSPFPAA
jgi:hypothetical protein